MWLGVLNATAYAVAMAYLESAIVVYLRRLYYPQGLSFPLTIADIEGLRYLMAHQSVFDFPLAIIDTPTLLLELGREAATMVMLATVGIAAGRTKVGKFAYFLLLFGVWDIWYYIWLKVFLGWPASLLTWDVLFLIPVPWVGSLHRRSHDDRYGSGDAPPRTARPSIGGWENRLVRPDGRGFHGLRVL